MKLRLKELRKNAKMSQQHLADLIGMSKSYYSELENEKKPINSLRLEKLADALGVSTGDLFESAPVGKNGIAEKVANLLSQLDPSVQEQLVPQLQGLVDAQRAEPE